MLIVLWNMEIYTDNISKMNIFYVHTVQETGRVPGSVWTGAENLSSTGIRSLDSAIP
jgi:hypothetical protein